PLKNSGGMKLALRCVAAKQKFIDPPVGAKNNANCPDAQPKPKDTSDNANSIALLLEYGPFRFWDGGDLTWNMEAEVVCPANRIGLVEFYQVNPSRLDIEHYPLLVHRLAPTISLMNNGPRKGTEKATVATLKSSPGIQAMYQVHRNVRDDSENNTPDE